MNAKTFLQALDFSPYSSETIEKLKEIVKNVLPLVNDGANVNQHQMTAIETMIINLNIAGITGTDKRNLKEQLVFLQLAIFINSCQSR